MQRQISPFQDLISLIKLYSYFRKEKPDIVHSITPKAGLLSMMASRFAGVPHRLHTFTGLVFLTKRNNAKILILMDKILCWCATDIYPEGNGVKKDLENFNKPKNH
jgi:UDP-N-acetylglucosamine:LPS N-acetylglucosamine transferase